MKEDKRETERLLKESKRLKIGKAVTLDEYAKVFTKIIGAEPTSWRWVGAGADHTPLSILEVGESYYFDFDDVQTVVDRLEDWLNRYGSLHAVAYEVLEWHEWALAQVHEEDGYPAAVDVFEWKFERFLKTRPAICLEHWLMGCPRKIEHTDRDKERVLKAKMQMVAELIGNYGSKAHLAEVMKKLDDDILAIHEKVASEDKRIQDEFRKSAKWKELMNDLEEEVEMVKKRAQDET